MKQIIQEDKYSIRITKLIHRFPIEVIVIGFVVIFIAQLVLKVLNGENAFEGIAETGSSSFFYAAVVSALVYFIKKRRFGDIFQVPANETIKGDVEYFLPVIEGSSMTGVKVGYLIVQNNELVFVYKRVDGFVEGTRFKNIKNVKVTSGKAGFNPYTLFVFGFMDTLVVEDKKVKLVFNMYQPEEIVTDLRSFIETLE